MLFSKVEAIKRTAAGFHKLHLHSIGIKKELNAECDDGVHLSENGVTNLITTLVKFLRGGLNKTNKSLS